MVSVAGVVVLALFLFAEGRARHPMMPLITFRSRQFSASNAVTFVLYAALAMVLFLVSLVLQRSLGYSPLAAGAALFPITLIMLLFSARSGELAQRIGPRLQMALGPLVVGAGLVLMVRVKAGSPYGTTVLPAVLVFGAGLAVTVAPLTATVLAAADERQSGTASGINNAVARVGGLVAVAAVPLLTGFDPNRRLPASTLLDGFHATVLIAAGLAGLLAWLTVRPDVLQPATESLAEPAAEPTTERATEREPCFNCPVDAAPLVAYSSGRGGTESAGHTDTGDP